MHGNHFYLLVSNLFSFSIITLVRHITLGAQYIPDFPTPESPTTAMFNTLFCFLEKLLRKLNGDALAGGVLGDVFVDIVQVSVPSNEWPCWLIF